jgi:hypothetical protein
VVGDEEDGTHGATDSNVPVKCLAQLTNLSVGIGGESPPPMQSSAPQPGSISLGFGQERPECHGS